MRPRGSWLGAVGVGHRCRRQRPAGQREKAGTWSPSWEAVVGSARALGDHHRGQLGAEAATSLPPAECNSTHLPLVPLSTAVPQRSTADEKAKAQRPPGD